MWLIESRFGRSLTWFTHLLVLNLLWLVGCLAIVTSPASTAALFDVLRQRHGGTESGVVGPFFTAFRDYFWRATAAGACCGAVGAVLLIDEHATRQMGGTGGATMRVVVYAVLIIYALAAVALFPVLVSFDASVGKVLRTALLVPLVTPARAVGSLLVVTTAVVLITTVPIAGLLAVAVAANIVQRTYQGGFRRLVEHAAAGTSSSTDPRGPNRVTSPRGSNRTRTST